jgi:glycosyltransferase involved in cell wall biosynthesis
MRLGINATTLDERPSGVGHYTARVIGELTKRVPEMLVYATVGAIAGVPSAAIRDVSPHVRPSLGRRGHLARMAWVQTVLPRRLSGDGVTLGLTTCPEPMLASPVPQVCVIHDLIALRFPQYFPRLYWYFRAALPLLARRCAAVIVDSEATRRDAISFLGLRGDTVYVVPPGLDRERFHPAVDPEPVRRRYGLGRYVLCVGTLLPHKNVPGLLRAFARLASRCPHDLVVAGHRDPRFIAEAEAEIVAGGLERRVRWLDYVPAADLPGLYAGADLYVHPSLYEGFGLTVLEAMACGTPVVSGRGGSLPEVGGDAVVWVDPEDVIGLAEAMERALSDPVLRRGLRHCGRARTARFTWEATGQRVFDILRALGGPGPHR